MTGSRRRVPETRRRDARRIDFYSMLAHDLRTPLSAMLMRADWLLAGRRGVLQPEVRSDVQKIDARIRELVALINDFLDLARMESAGVALSREVVDLNEVVRVAVDEYTPLASASRLELGMDAADRPALVDVDRKRIVQVLANLVSNAIKFTPPEGRIVVRVLAGDDRVRTIVEDTGRGIAPDVLPRLFNRYERGPHLSSDVGGTGLGLMIVREIVEAHGGEITVSSDIGRGSAFTVALPRFVDEPAVSPPRGD